MVKSLPLWSVLLSQFSEHWYLYVMMAYLPTYLNSVLQVDLKEVSTGAHSSRRLGAPLYNPLSPVSPNQGLSSRPQAGNATTRILIHLSVAPAPGGQNHMVLGPPDIQRASCF